MWQTSCGKSCFRDILCNLISQIPKSRYLRLLHRTHQTTQFLCHSVIRMTQSSVICLPVCLSYFVFISLPARFSREQTFLGTICINDEDDDKVCRLFSYQLISLLSSSKVISGGQKTLYTYYYLIEPDYVWVMKPFHAAYLSGQ